MTPLDDLLSAAGRVDEITPGQVGRARACLDPAIGGAPTRPAARAAVRGRGPGGPGSACGGISRSGASRWPPARH